MISSGVLFFSTLNLQLQSPTSLTKLDYQHKLLSRFTIATLIFVIVWASNLAHCTLAHG
jgi:hypothetical protein